MENGLRLLLAARKSRKADDTDGMERQDHRARTWAEREVSPSPCLPPN
jgi:hypothetical protein